MIIRYWNNRQYAKWCNLITVHSSQGNTSLILESYLTLLNNSYLIAKTCG